MTAHPAFLIAVTGGSGSGKSTLAAALLDRFGPGRAVLLVEDAYYRPRAEHGEDAAAWSPGEVEQRINFDDPAAKDMAMLVRHLGDLRSGRGVDQPVYDFAKHDRAPGRLHHVGPAPVVISEGVHVLSDPSLRPMFDLAIFVDTPADIRLARRIRRDVLERGRAAERVVEQYLRFVREAHQRFTEPARALCDLVLADDGPLAVRDSAPSTEAVERLLGPVLARLAAAGVAPGP